MSLIQEALKRQKEEAEQAQLAIKVKTGAPSLPPRTAPPLSAPLQVAAIPPKATPAPSAPPPLPLIPQSAPPPMPQPAEAAAEEAPLAETEPREQKKALSKLAIVLVLILLLIVGGIVLAYLGWTKMRASIANKAQTALLPAVTQALATAVQTAATTQQAVATQQVPTPVAPGTQTPAVAPPAAPATPQTAVAPVAPPQAVATQAAAVVKVPAPAATTQTVAAVQNPPPPAAASNAAVAPVSVTPLPGVKAPVTWPPMKLTAIIGKGKKGTARLNGQLLVVGEELDGVTLVELSEHGVVLEYKGEHQNLKLGGTIP